MVLFFTLCIISSLKSTIQNSIPTKLGDPPVLDRAITIYNQIFLYPSVLFYGISIILALCLFRPDDDDDPKIIAIIFQIFTALILLAASFLGYAGNAKLTSAFKEDYFQSIQNKNAHNIEKNIQDSFQKSVELTMILSNNLSNIDHNSNMEIKLLNNFTKKYDNAFSNNQSQYRLSFDKIYTNANNDNNIFLIDNLVEMDNSRKSMFFSIASFTKKCFEFSKSIKNTLKNIKKIYNITSTKNFNEKIYNITGNIQKSDEVEQWYSTKITYIMCTGILVHAIAYSIVFFCNNKFSRCCFCLYPVFALALTVTTFFTCYYMKSKVYKRLIKDCKQQSNTNFNDFDKLISDIKKDFINLKIDERLTESFNDKIEVENIYQLFSSENIHKNYISIYFQYATYSNYRDDLIKIVQVINENEYLLTKMRELIFDISNNSSLVIPMIKNMQDEIEALFDVSNNFEMLKSSSICDTIINGVNCATIGCFLFIFGLLFMGASVCLRRIHMEDKIRVSNYDRNPLETTFIGEKVVYFAAYIKSVESVSIIRTELSTPDCIITYLRGKYKKSQSIQSYLYRKDLFGEGFYFSSTKKDAIIELANKIGHEMKLNQIVFIVCQVDFGNSLIVPFDKRSYFSYPSSLKNYSCHSVSGSTENLCEYVVYDINQIVPIQFELAKLADLE